MKTAAKENFGFNERLELGQKGEDRVCRIFSEYGLKAHLYGLGTLPLAARNALIKLNDVTSLFIRFAPDFFCPIPGKYTILVESKNDKGNTPNYSYNLDCYKAGLELADLGMKILCVFGGHKAEWIQKLPIYRVIDKQEHLRSVGGSQKSFVLIPKKELRNLREILGNLSRSGNNN